jgi:polyhydroxyalkanoate synthase
MACLKLWERRSEPVNDARVRTAIPPDDTAPDPLEGLAELVDRSMSAAVGQWTGGLSPGALADAFADWALHLAHSPGRQMLLGAKAARKALRLVDYIGHALEGGTGRCIEPLRQDHRFDDPRWDTWPFGLYQQSFLLLQQWLDVATRNTGGVSGHHEEVVRFTLRQMLDMIAPTNFIATNPLVQQRIFETGGFCLVRGARNFAEDWQRLLRRQGPAGTENFRAGQNLAVTPGQVVYRNELVELIQYEPATANVRPEPLLIVPAWIMKYYILDLSPENSLVRYLVSQGFTVFMISWRNPGPEQRNLAFEDYRKLGVMASLDVVTTITGGARVHGCGYCLGGTLLAIAAAAAMRDGDERFASLTLLAAQTEFSEPGEIGLFIDPAQVHFLESMMWQRGYLDSSQMGGTFQMLRSADLIWSRVVQDYLLGERHRPSDLMAWNADGTRMPYAMHSEYLRRLFLNDDLAEGRFTAEGRAVSLAYLTVPMFVVGTETDHVAPWRSVFKLHLLTNAAIRFVLTSEGHNAGIISPPDKNRHYRLGDRPEGGNHPDPDSWCRTASCFQGSWWPQWVEWLAGQSGEPAQPPSLGNPENGFAPMIGAPGTYVLQR